MGSPTFALDGIAGVYNYGCEAIVRGTTTILRHQWPDCRILYASHRPEYDARALHDLGVELVSAKTHVPFIRRAVNKAFRMTGLLYRMKVRRYYDWLSEVDCVLSIGGDIFTMWPGDETAGNFPRAEHANFIMHSGRPLVLWGASVGPFDANPRAVRAYTGALNRMTLITVREQLTVDYLTRLGITSRVGLVADPAFLLDPDDSHAGEDGRFFAERPVLGVNLSPLSVHYAGGTEELPARQARMLGVLLDSHDVEIVLIPHVICTWQEEDDDYRYLAGLRERIDPRLRSRVRLLPADLGARRTKWVVSRCRALVSARMHCAIAGLSTGVPTLLVSYSRKAQGICEYAYGHGDWVLPVGCEEGQFVEAVGRLLGRCDELHSDLSERGEGFRQDAMKAGRFLADSAIAASAATAGKEVWSE